MNQCKHLGATIDGQLSFQTRLKKIIKNIAVVIKFTATVQYLLPTTVFKMLLQLLVFSHLGFSALCLFHFSSIFVLSLEKPKLSFEFCIFFSRSNSSQNFKKSKSVIGI